MANLLDFTNKIIDDGINACQISYKNDKLKREGAVAGFEACRGKNIEELKKLLADATLLANASFASHDKNYWYLRCFEAEIEWVCNCVSALLHDKNMEVIITPTTRGIMKASDVIDELLKV